MIVLNYSISLSEFGSTKIVVYVQDVRKKWLRENFLFIHFLGTKLHYTLKSTAHTLLAAMLKHVTLSFCVMRMLLKVIWSPGLDMQRSQGIHCRNSMLTCTNTTITTRAIVALLFKWWTYSRKYSKAGQKILMCNKNVHVSTIIVTLCRFTGNCYDRQSVSIYDNLPFLWFYGVIFASWSPIKQAPVVTISGCSAQLQSGSLWWHWRRCLHCSVLRLGGGHFLQECDWWRLTLSVLLFCWYSDIPRLYECF